MPKVIVIACVRDEEWILDKFLSTCSAFADHIVISDCSTGIDRTAEIYQAYPKVSVIPWSGPPDAENRRRRELFASARKIEADKRIIIAIDADEIISGNLFKSPEWNTVLSAEKGSLFFMQWVTLWHTPLSYRIDSPKPVRYGPYARTIWVDDGVSEIPESGREGMHIVYTPWSAPRTVRLNDIVCLHYQFCNWPRMAAKHRLYRVHEKADMRRLNDLGIYRLYGYMDGVEYLSARCPDSWFDGWRNKGIDVTSIEFNWDPKLTHYDLDVLAMIDKNGPEMFALQDIWVAPWETIIAEGKKSGRLPENYRMTYPKNRLSYRIFRFYMRNTRKTSWLHKWERVVFKRARPYWG